MTPERLAVSVALPLLLLLPHGLTARAQPASEPAQQVSAPAPQPSDSLTVGIHEDPPFVTNGGDEPTGMAIDIWKDVARGLDRDYRFVSFETIRDLIDATSSGKIDVAVTSLTISEDRARRVDFTQPWFNGGMRIMVDTGDGGGFSGLIAGLARAGYLKAYAWIALVIVVATLGFTLFDRRFNDGFPKRWRDGIAESFYTVMSVATSGRPPSRANLFGWVGRIWQGLWLVCGIAVLAFVTSSVTSVMTTLSLTGHIDSVADLADKRVGVMTGTVEEEFAQSKGLSFRSYPDLQDSVDALLNDEVAALIGDGPALVYYEYKHPDQPVKVVGRTFKPDKYGFAVQRESPLRHLLTVEILSALDSGEVAALKTKYFGANASALP